MALHHPLPDVIAYFQLARAPEIAPRYNLAPSQAIPVIRQDGEERVLTLLRWGLVPPWAKDVAIGHKLINARAETLLEKPSFRAPFHQRRCVIVASGFYEWQHGPAGRQAFYLTRRDGAPLALAGLWERRADPDQPENVLETCTVITTAANATVATLHERMPALLAPDELAAWFSPHLPSKEHLDLLHPAAEDLLTLTPVSDYVNAPAHEGAECIRPLSSATSA